MIRFLDFIFSLLGIILLFPVFLVLYFAVRLESKGGGFYKQLRVGRGGTDFYVYKFRSMRIGADKQGLITVGGRDPRITRIGYFIRKYKLDELPELWNVLIGDMSFVGPRPDVPGYADSLQGEDRLILKLRPGITGPASLKYANEEEILATVNDPIKYNDEIIFPDKVRINLNYYYHHTFLGDIKLIFQTIFRSYELAEIPQNNK